MTKRIKYLLDTDTCSYILKRKPLSVLEKFESIGVESISLSIITYSELLYGAQRTQSKRINLKVINEFTDLFTILDWDKNAAIEYAKIREYLERTGQIIGNMDLMIAAAALSIDCTLITNNQKHFCKVPNLNIENWVIDN